MRIRLSPAPTRPCPSVQVLQEKMKKVTERLEALSAVEEFQAERGRLEATLAWAPARALRASLEKNHVMAEQTGPEGQRRARARARPGRHQRVTGVVLLAAPPATGPQHCPEIRAEI